MSKIKGIDMLREQRDRKNGVITPLQVLENATERVKSGEITDLIVIGLNKDLIVELGNSQMLDYTALGLMEKAKDIILSEDD